MYLPVCYVASITLAWPHQPKLEYLVHSKRASFSRLKKEVASVTISCYRRWYSSTIQTRIPKSLNDSRYGTVQQHAQNTNPWPGGFRACDEMDRVWETKSYGEYFNRHYDNSSGGSSSSVPRLHPIGSVNRSKCKIERIHWQNELHTTISRTYQRWTSSTALLLVTATLCST